MKKMKTHTDHPVDMTPDTVEAVPQDEWKTKYMRALADYQNLIRRSAEESKEVYSRTEKDLVTNLIPIADLFDEVLKHDHYKSDPGLRAVRAKLADVLHGYGVEGRPVIGTLFDPVSMECVDTREVREGEKENYVVDVLQPLYIHRGQVYRPARVIVAKK